LNVDLAKAGWNQNRKGPVLGVPCGYTNTKETAFFWIPGQRIKNGSFDLVDITPKAVCIFIIIGRDEFLDCSVGISIFLEIIGSDSGESEESKDYEKNRFGGRCGMSATRHIFSLEPRARGKQLSPLTPTDSEVGKNQSKSKVNQEDPKAHGVTC
jgi:hypothetical protein